MSSDGEKTWIRRLNNGDREAFQQLWADYFRRLVGLARKKLGDAQRRDADEEDVALSTFKSFWRGVKEGRFPDLEDPTDLWRLLVVITDRKVHRLHARRNCEKRGPGLVRGESVFAGADNEEERGLEQVVGKGLTPEFADAVADACQDLLAALPDDVLRQIAQAKLEGYTNQEIADKLEIGLSTIERKLNRIRAIWDAPQQPQ
jgi:DNA-directed RNA polymerase specialized sigma24 family protein